MRFILYPILLCVGLTANAQDQRFFEVGISGGYVFPYVMKQKALTATANTGSTGAFDVHFNFQHRSPLYFTLGLSAGFMSFPISEKIDSEDNEPEKTLDFNSIQLTPGVQYKKSITDNLSWRVGLEVSGALEAQDLMWNSQSNIIPKLYVGLMIDDAFSFGINYAKPVKGYETFINREAYWGNVYGVHALTFDFRLNTTELKRRGDIVRARRANQREETIRRWKEKRRARRGR